MMLHASSWTAFFAICIATMAAAQETTTQPADTSGPTATTEPSTATQTDPTRADQRLQAFLKPATTKPTAEKSKLVRITRCGFVQTDNHEPEALIEIEGAGIVSVKTGSTVSVATRQGQSLTIHVIKLAPDEIEIEVPATGEKATIR
jgi:hypothetical protein